MSRKMLICSTFVRGERGDSNPRPLGPQPATARLPARKRCPEIPLSQARRQLARAGRKLDPLPHRYRRAVSEWSAIVRARPPSSFQANDPDLALQSGVRRQTSRAANGSRTRDLKLGKLALYQLSYRRTARILRASRHSRAEDRVYPKRSWQFQKRWTWWESNPLRWG
jgi:hypothetical protein